MQRDPPAAVKQTTLDGHRLRVRAFVEQFGDIPLASVTRAVSGQRCLPKRVSCRIER